MRGLLAIAAVALTGCGTSSFLGSDSATDTVRSFLEAAAAHDGARACGLLNGHGQQVMGVYPQRLGGSGAAAPSCQQTVSRLGALPHPDDWEAMARGRICVYGTNGADSQTVTVSYRRRGLKATAAGSLQPNLGPGYRLMVPPTPVGAQSATAPPSGAPRCSAAAD